MVRGRSPRFLRFAALAASAIVADCAPFIAHSASPAAPAALVTADAAVSEPFGPPRPSADELEVAWAKELAPLKIECANTGAKATLRLYEADGTIDPEAIAALSEVAADANGVFPLQTRLAQLAVKAAHHFDATSLVVVSGYRKPRKKDSEDHHARGEALDFRLPGVDYRKLAAYLRGLPRVGVGVYTDPRTHYVHLDVRDKSFHWLDASPPGVTWREAAIPDAKQATKDAAYTEESDLPLDSR